MEKVTCPTCGGTKFSTVNDIYDERGVVEFDMKCPVCDVIVAHWAYDVGKPIEFDPDAPFDKETEDLIEILDEDQWV